MPNRAACKVVSLVRATLPDRPLRVAAPRPCRRLPVVLQLYARRDRPNSRLSCCLNVDKQLGKTKSIVIRLPTKQTPPRPPIFDARRQMVARPGTLGPEMLGRRRLLVTLLRVSLNVSLSLTRPGVFLRLGLPYNRRQKERTE